MGQSIVELKHVKNDLVKVQRAMLDKADAKKRGMLDSERAEFKLLDARIDEVDSQIIALEADLEARRKMATREIELRSTGRLIKAGGTGRDLADLNPEKEFRNVGEMLFAVAKAKQDLVIDPRLDSLREKREQSMGIGAAGGYAIPQQFDANLRQVAAAESAVRSRATVIPAGYPPDARLTFPALDQTGGQNMFGGIQVFHTGEGSTISETDLHLREVSLEPHEITGYLVTTQKLLNNWEACGAVLSAQLAGAVRAQEDFDFIQGHGVARSLARARSAFPPLRLRLSDLP